MTYYIQKPLKTLPKNLELSNKVKDVSRYKIDVQKSVAFLYTNETIRESNPIYNLQSCLQLFSIQNNAILKDELKAVEDLYIKNYKIMMK